MPTLTKISLERAEELTRIPRRISNTDAYKRLEGVGWELVRTGHHHIFKKDGQTLTLPGTGDLSPWLTQLVYKASAEIPKDRQNAPRLPLMVKYRGREYGVTGQKGGFYSLVDLLTGVKHIGLIVECFPITEDEAPRLPFAESVHIAEPAPEPVIEEPIATEEVTVEHTFVPAPAITLPTDDDDFESWARMTEKFIDTLGIRIEKLLHEAASLEERQKSLRQTVMEMRGEQPAPEPEPRRIVLPPAEPNKARDGFKVSKYNWTRRHFTAEDEKKVIDYRANKMSLNEMAERLGKARTTLYHFVSLLKEEGKLQ